MGAPEVLRLLSARGVRVERDGGDLLLSPKAALTDELRGLIREHKAELLEAVSSQPEAATDARAAGAALPPVAVVDAAQDRTARALAYLQEHQEVKRACFADAKADPENIILTVAVREPLGAVEILVSRSKFDAFALMELSLCWPDTALFIPEH